MQLRTSEAHALLRFLLAAIAMGCVGAAPRELALRPLSLDLPGVPSAVVPADLDGDGNLDLLVVVAHTHWEQITEDRVEDMVQMIEVVPALFDRREARVWLGDGKGGYRPLAEPMPLPMSVLSVEAGGPGLPALALTDEGIAAFRVKRGDGAEALTLEPLIRETPVLARSGVLLSNLGFVHDLDGDGRSDVLVPAKDGVALYLWNGSRFGSEPVQRLKLPGDVSRSGAQPSRSYPLPEVSDLDGDSLPDLLVHPAEGGSGGEALLRGSGGGRFEEARTLSPRCFGLPPSRPPEKPNDGAQREKKKKSKEKKEPRIDGEILFVGDLDGDRSAEVVVRKETETGDEGLKEAKEPRSVLELHHVRAGLVVDREPYHRFDIKGYPIGGSWPDFTEGGFKDLDGDGRLDLVTVTLDFSVLQVVRVLVTKTVSIGVEFHVFAQGADGRFRGVEGLDLTEKLKFDLNNLEMGRFAQFEGDFDGDGRTDFIHLGRGKQVTIHRGQPGCRYAAKPDLAIEIAEEPRNIGLVRVMDYDGDGRSDLSVIRPLPSPEEGVTSPIRLDLYLSGAAP